MIHRHKPTNTTAATTKTMLACHKSTFAVLFRCNPSSWYISITHPIRTCSGLPGLIALRSLSLSSSEMLSLRNLFSHDCFLRSDSVFHRRSSALLSSSAAYSCWCFTATPIGVLPVLSLTCRLAPPLHSTASTAWCPKEAAQWSGVDSCESRTFTSAPASSRVCTTPACPAAAAQCIAVQPCSLSATSSGPSGCLTSFRISSECPLLAFRHKPSLHSCFAAFLA
mmetsp:Transcript_27877/g.70242  ORF Transcript_27877/g.70242 Transcript_27877/m.70242 type:complete len:224 (-) Transcript_27877:22-693(-)